MFIGGELFFMVMVDLIIRFIDNVIRKESYEYELFEGDGLLDYL